jgi:hypothetical protein
VRKVSGLDGNPKDLGMTRAAFLIHLLETLNEKHPDFSKCPREKELKIIGGVMDPSENLVLAHVLYDYRASIKSKVSETKFIKPGILTLAFDQNQWRCWTAIGGVHALNLWSIDLDSHDDSPKLSKKTASEAFHN